MDCEAILVRKISRLVPAIAEYVRSTGNVGWGAVSYFAMSAYHTAVLKPPHLKSIMLWEGISDL